jgi:hypothetical protein
MDTQPDELRRLLGDTDCTRAAAERIAGRRNVARRHRDELARRPSRRVAARRGGRRRARGARADAAQYGPGFDATDAVIVLSHTGHTGYTTQALEAAGSAGAAIVNVSGRGQRRRRRDRASGDLVRLHREPHRRAAAAGADRRGAGASLGDLSAVPDAVPACSPRPGR